MDETNSCQVITPEVISSLSVPEKASVISAPSEQIKLRDQKIREYYKGETLTEKMLSDDISVESLIRCLLAEFSREADNLAGNQMMATENGNIESSTVISSKRVEIIEKTIKAIMAKKEFEATNSIDVDSPSMRIVFRYFMSKCQESFGKAGMGSDISDVFFRNMNDVMANWKRDIKKQIAEIKS